MKREQSARTSVDPPSGIARLICPITLNNPRDNSIAWYPGTVREVAQLSANFLQFVNMRRWLEKAYSLGLFHDFDEKETETPSRGWFMVVQDEARPPARATASPLAWSPPTEPSFCTCLSLRITQFTAWSTTVTCIHTSARARACACSHTRARINTDTNSLTGRETGRSARQTDGERDTQYDSRRRECERERERERRATWWQRGGDTHNKTGSVSLSLSLSLFLSLSSRERAPHAPERRTPRPKSLSWKTCYSVARKHDRPTYGLHGQTDGRMDEWMDGWMDG
ncbi:hypothetical protein ALC56_15195 [Trachymyrmex septentrionalis]|uniref:Uncharacterized protein n=1 Tax=Trachymyrmex septentrionalis TaxID=34720 RepID=A0A195ERJ5_9HYME|nr:hypothetical protein ALC56_15195 [Trachymyrmex septentrionalis]